MSDDLPATQVEQTMMDEDKTAEAKRAAEILDRSDDNAQAIEPPIDALTWRSSEERNRLLHKWRRAVLPRYGEQPRALRVAWVLESLFNVKRGYAFPSNEYLAAETGMTERDVQKGLQALDDVIVRVVKRGGNTDRKIWPRRLFDTSTVDVPRHVHDVDTHNLRRLHRIPRTQMATARAAAELRDRREHEAAMPRKRWPSVRVTPKAERQPLHRHIRG